MADQGNQVIRVVHPDGTTSTLAGQPGIIGSSDGSGSAASFDFPEGIALGSDGNLYVTDTGNNVIRKVTPAGEVSTFAGQVFEYGSTDGAGPVARFSSPQGITADAGGNLYVARHPRIKPFEKSRLDAVVSTIAGTTGVAGFKDGGIGVGQFNNPTAIALDATGAVYVSDTGNNAVRRLGTDVAVVDSRGRDEFLRLTRRPVWRVRRCEQSHSLWRTRGTYTCCKGWSRPTEIAVSVMAGLTGNTPGSIDAAGAYARLNNPNGLAIDANGGLVITDTGNNTIRRGQFSDPFLTAPPGDVTANAGLPVSF